MDKQFDRVNNELRKAHSEWEEKLVSNSTYQVCLPFVFGISEDYFSSKSLKIMIIGKEPYHFKDYDYKDSNWPIEKNQNWSIDYSLVQIKKKKLPNMSVKPSPFWRFYRHFSDYALCWNNINKFECVSYDTSAFFNGAIDGKETLLQKQIALSECNAIILAVGPKYKSSIISAFQLNEDDLQESLSIENNVIDLTNQIGLSIPIFWTYHPNHLQQCKIFNSVVNKITTAIKNYKGV